MEPSLLLAVEIQNALVSELMYPLHAPLHPVAQTRPHRQGELKAITCEIDTETTSQSQSELHSRAPALPLKY